MILGTIAAFCWGIADFFVAVYTRRFGTTRVLLVGTFAALLVYGTAFLLDAPSAHIEARDLVPFVCIAFIVVVTYLAFYRGLEEGPVAIVTPIAAAYTAVVVVLAMMILHERLSTTQAIGAAAAIVGVVLASIDRRKLQPGAALVGKGTLFALLAMLGFGLASFGGGFFAQKYGWVKPALYIRVLATGMFLVVGSMNRQWPWQIAENRGRVIGALVAIGAVDAIGFLAFSKGAEIGMLSVVATASAAYPLIPLILGLVVFKEKLATNQMVGVAAVMAGVLVLGLAQ
ncbi:MAG: EamA family transporter [Actinomycetota bacterium]